MKRLLLILCTFCLLLSFGGCKQAVDERTLPVWELKISDEAKLEVMWCYAKAYPSTVGFELVAYNVDSLSQLWDAKAEAATQNRVVGFRYYGTFGDCIVWRSGSNQSSWSDFEIAGYAFEDVDVNCLSVCREGELLTLTMAYAMGYISAEDVGIVCQRHKDYVAHYFPE